ncbi:RAD50-interacting protein 1-like protein, partial [Euroglyphus maynei]
PEYYLCSLEQWITLNEQFLCDVVDKILSIFFDKVEKSATVELISCFVKLIERKLRQDLPRMADNDRIFIRTIDELIIFSKHLELIEPDFYENYPELSPLYEIFSDVQNFK